VCGERVTCGKEKEKESGIAEGEGGYREIAICFKTDITQSLVLSAIEGFVVTNEKPFLTSKRH
jgi:hypothetical protein